MMMIDGGDHSSSQSSAGRTDRVSPTEPLDHDPSPAWRSDSLVGGRAPRLPQRPVERRRFPLDSAQQRTTPMWPMIPSAPVRMRRWLYGAAPCLTDSGQHRATPVPASASAGHQAQQHPGAQAADGQHAPTAMATTPIPPAIPWVG